jgi:Flp pilus assembly pilin Flp
MKRKERKIAGRQWRMRRPFLRDAAGAVAVELGLLTPFLAILTIGIVDLGNLLNNWQALAAAARIGAEYAMNSPVCKNPTTGINLIVNPPNIQSACMTNIEDAVTHSLNYSSLTFPNLVSCTDGVGGQCFPITCECDDGTSIACGSSCAAASPARPGPNRIFITIAARQSFTPMIAWSGMPSAINGVAELRLQ